MLKAYSLHPRQNPRKALSFQNLILKFGLFLLLFFSAAQSCLAEDSFEYEAQEDNFQISIAKVTDVTAVNLTEDGKPLEQIVKLELLEGPLKGQKKLARNLIPENVAYSIVAKKNKKYVIAYDDNTGEIYITDYYRQPTLFFVLGLFLFLLLLIGGDKGLKAIISLVLIMLAIFYGLIPAIKIGINPILAAILISAFSTATTMLLVAGRNKKSLAATLGTTGGVTVAGILAYFMIKMAPLTGLASSEARILMGNLGDDASAFDFQGVLASGVLIASLGAAMDVAISIASSAQEIYLTNKKQSRSKLFAHAMNVGKDIMGTMTNTLVLAYTGSAIPLFLLLSNESFTKILNLEVIVTELTAAIVGSIGLLLAIPITAVLSTFFLKGLKKSSEKGK